MADITPLILEVKLKQEQAEAEIKALQTSLNNLGKSAATQSKLFSQLGTAIKVGFTAALAGAGVVMTQAVKAASDLNETTTAVDAVFGQASTQLKEYAKTASSTMGQSQTQFLGAAKTFGVFGKAAGLASEANVKFSTDLTKLASDLASFNNTSVDDAIQALGAGLRGESEPLRRFGVLLDDATLKARAMEMKIYSGSGALSQQQRVLAAQAEILKQTSLQQGDFIKTSDGLANSQRTLSATWEDAMATLGEGLTPVVADFVQQLVPLVKEYVPKLAEAIKKLPLKEWATGLFQVLEFVVKNAEAIKNWVGVVATAVAAWKAYTIAVEIAKAAQILFNAALATSPIGLTMIALGLLAGAYIFLKDKTDDSTKGLQDWQTAAVNANKVPIADEIYTTLTGKKTTAQQIAEQYKKQNANIRSRTIASNYGVGAAGAVIGKADVVITKKEADPLDKNGNGIPDALEGGGGGGGGGDNKKKTITENKTVKAYLAKTRESIRAAKDRYSDAVNAANDANLAAIANAERAYADEVDRVTRIRDDAITKMNALIDIVNQSMNRLRDAFAKATEVSIVDIFKGLKEQGEASADGLISAMKAKLTAAKELAANAAKLYSAGFSQTFIEQVVAAGPNVGNELAKSILDAAPESQKELQDLFGQTETLSGTGMDKLSQTIYQKSGLATDALKQLYTDTEKGLTTSLGAQQKIFVDMQATIQKDFNSGMVTAKKTMDDAILAANNALNQALIDAANALNDQLDRIEAEMNAKLLSMKSKLAGAGQDIANTRNGLNQNYVAVPAKNYTASELKAMDAAEAKQKANKSVSVSITNNITEPGASAYEISGLTLDAIKYGVGML